MLNGAHALPEVMAITSCASNLASTYNLNGILLDERGHMNRYGNGWISGNY